MLDARFSAPHVLQPKKLGLTSIRSALASQLCMQTENDLVQAVDCNDQPDLWELEVVFNAYVSGQAFWTMSLNNTEDDLDVANSNFANGSSVIAKGPSSTSTPWAITRSPSNNSTYRIMPLKNTNQCVTLVVNSVSPLIVVNGNNNILYTCQAGQGSDPTNQDWTFDNLNISSYVP